MRYVINDDDLENWYEILKNVTNNINKNNIDNHISNIEYIIHEMEIHINDNHKNTNNINE